MSYVLKDRDIATGAAVSRFEALKLDTGAVVKTTAATEAVYGVAQDSADSGEEVDVVRRGLTKAIAGAAISKGDKVMPAADGKFVKDDGSTASRILAGEAYTAAAADGDVFFVILDQNTTAE